MFTRKPKKQVKVSLISSTQSYPFIADDIIGCCFLKKKKTCVGPTDRRKDSLNRCLEEVSFGACAGWKR